MTLSVRWERDGAPAVLHDYSAAVLGWLTAFGGVRLAGELVGGGVLVRDGFEGAYRVWSITDNGGELNVQPVNDDAAMRSVPFTADGRMVNPATLAYRLHQAMRGREIRWDWLFPEFDGLMRPGAR